MKRLYLHIGTHYTDSTPVQNYLYGKRDKLAKLGILYPAIALDDSAHHQLARATGTGSHKPDPTLLASAIESIAQQSQAPTIHSVSLSSEELWESRNVVMLKGLADHFDTRVVMYLRRQDHYLEAAYNRHVRSYHHRFAGSIYQFALKYNFFDTLNYRLLTSRWEDVFGRKSIIVRPYGSTIIRGNTCNDLLKLMDAGRLNTSKNPTGTRTCDDTSLPAAAVPYLARLNREPLNYTQHHNVLRVLEAVIPKVHNGRLLANRESSDFYNSFKISNRYVWERHLNMDTDSFAHLSRPVTQEVYISHTDIDDHLMAQVRAAAALPAAPSQAPPEVPTHSPALKPKGGLWQRIAASVAARAR